MDMDNMEVVQKKRKTCASKKQQQRDNQNKAAIEKGKSLSILVIVPNKQVVETLAKDHTDFYQWIQLNCLLKEDVLTKFCPSNAAAHSFFYKKSKNNDGIMLQSPHMAWAYEVACALQETRSPTHIEFGLASSFLNGVLKCPDELARFITKSKCFNLVLLCDDTYYRSGNYLPQNDYNHDVYNFCSIKLRDRGVMTFPPNVQLTHIDNKHELRDPPIASKMVPTVYFKIPVNKSTTWTSIATSAQHQLVEICVSKVYWKKFTMYCSKATRLVAKAWSGGGTEGVYFLEKDAKKHTWLARRMKHSKKVKVADYHGIVLQFQPYFEELKKEEIRIAAVAKSTSKTRVQFQWLWCNETCFDTKGNMTTKHPIPFSFFRKEKDRQEVKSLITEAFHQMIDSYPLVWECSANNNLTFRFDIFQCSIDHQYYLNEIELFPVATALLFDIEEGDGNDTFVKLWAEATARYLHSKLLFGVFGM